MARPVLVIGAQPRSAVTIARSLNRKGVPVDVASYSLQEPRISSRAVRQFIRLPDPRGGPDEFVSSLSKLIETHKYDMLIPCSDSALSWIGQHHEYLSTMLHVGCPPPQILKRVLEKNITLEVAKSCEIPIPATYLVSDATDLVSLHSTLRFPMIAKPRSKMEIETHAFKVHYFHTFEDLKEAFLVDAHFGKRTILQEYCAGEGVGVEMLIHNGEPVAMFQHRRLKEIPSTGGRSVLAISGELDPSLTRYALRLLRSLEWEGVAMVEFRYNRATKTAMLMEVNGRYWGSVSLSFYAGIDFPRYDWQIVHGEKPDVPASYQPGIRWRWTSGDVLRLHDVFAQSKSDGFPRRLKWKELVRFMKDLFPPTHDALWSMADPVPALSELMRTLKIIAVQDVKTVIKGLLPSRILSHIRTYRNLSLRDRSAYGKLQFLRGMGLRRDNLRRMRNGIRQVVFVCHGNIIRSPMAAALLSQSVSGGDHDAISVTSAGVHANLGRSADGRALTVAREFEISLDDHRAQQLTPELVNWADAIFVMDFILEAKVVGRCPEAKGKVFLLGAIRRRVSSQAVEITDPNNGDENDIRRCYEILQLKIRELAKMLFPRNQDRDHAAESCASAVRAVRSMP